MHKPKYKSRLMHEDIAFFPANGQEEAPLSAQSISEVSSIYSLPEQAETAESPYLHQLPFHLLAESLPQLVWMVTSDGQVKYVNHQWVDYTGLPIEQTQQCGWLDCVHPDDRERSIEIWLQNAHRGQSYQFEHRLRRASDNMYRWHLVHAVPMKDQTGHTYIWVGTCTDIHDQKNAEEDASQREYFYRMLADALPHGIWICHPDGQTAFRNQCWSQYTGLPAEQTASIEWLSVIHPDDRNEALRRWNESIRTKKPYENIIRVKRAVDGVYCWQLARGVPIHDQRGQCIAWLGSCTDIEEQKRSQEEIQRLLVSEQMARTQSEQTNQALRNFMSVVSHEFRTTLTGIQGFSELLCSMEYPEEVREFAADIHRDALRLKRMINDLLDTEKMQAGRMTLYLESVDLHALIEQEVTRLSLIAPTYHVHLYLDEHGPQLVADRDKLIQVLTNLLTNAVKYAPNCNDIDIGSMLEESHVHVWVRDGGLGIPADALEAIFLPYNRVHAQQSHSITGTGLGLPIVRQIIELHGGRVWVESTVGCGSTFHFTLPSIHT